MCVFGIFSNIFGLHKPTGVYLENLTRLFIMHTFIFDEILTFHRCYANIHCLKYLNVNISAMILYIFNKMTTGRLKLIHSGYRKD